VVDSASREPVAGVAIEILGSTSALTDSAGIFLFRDVAVGTHELVLEHLSYGVHARSVSLLPNEELALEVSISVRAIELAPLVVEALTELEARRISSGHSINEVMADEIERADRAGLTLSQLLQASMPGVLVRAASAGQTCVTYRAIRSDNDRGCNGVSVVLDGVPIADPSYVYGSLPLRDIERLEIMSPGQAGVRYGMRSGQGVLLVETKQGREERRRDVSRLLTGFDWSEESDPYPWLKVLGGSFVANALGVGAGLAMADRCFWTPDTSSFALRTRCHGAATAAASILSVVLPAVGGTLTARWGGATDRSRGRLVPSMVTAGMVLTGGYLLLIGGEGQSEIAGALVLGLAVPLTFTLSDRIFRVLR
jgi:hypothetical protein